MKTLRECLTEFSEKTQALGHFNISNIEGLRAIFSAAQELHLPVVIGVSEGEREFIGVRQAQALIQSLRDEHDFPIFLNADHTYSVEKVKEAIDAGFDSVIFDGAKLSLEENILQTRECVEYARKSGRDVVVEGELGYIGMSSKLLDDIPEGVDLENLTTSDDAKRFVQETGVDLFAPSVGNIHGMLKSAREPKLNIERIREIREAAGVPLVLHGGSGTSDEDFRKAIESGMSLVHVSTEIRVAYRDTTRRFLEENPDEIAPYRIMKPTVAAMSDVVKRRMKLFAGE